MGSAVKDAAKRLMVAVDWIKSHPRHVISSVIKILPLSALNKKVGHRIIPSSEIKLPALFEERAGAHSDQWPPLQRAQAIPQLSQLFSWALTFGEQQQWVRAKTKHALILILLIILHFIQTNQIWGLIYNTTLVCSPLISLKKIF